MSPSDEPIDTGSGHSAEPTVWVKVSAGYVHSCGLLSTGAIVCWGSRSWGVVGQVPIGTYQDVELGVTFACGLTDEGLAECWGCPGASEPDAANCTDEPPVQLVSLKAGAHHACGQTLDGDLLCWGAPVDEEHDQGFPGPFLDYSVADVATCVLDPRGVPVCRGSIGWDDDGDFHFVPDPPPGSRFDSLAAGQNHVCGIRTDGLTECWGQGNGPDVPVAPAPAESFTVIDGCAFDTCGLRSDGTVDCWGTMTLGDPVAFEGVPPPKSVAFESISVGEYHACGVVPGGSEIVCWGGGRDGEAEPPTLEKAIAIATGG